MNTLKNKVQLIGNLGQDPEIKKFDSGKTCARLSLATTESFRNNEGKRMQETHWHKLILWGHTAQIAEKYLRKGSEIAVEGKLTSRSYENKAGEKKYITEIVVNDILMLRNKEQN
jgi:single-strand DNA-binding protein